jgi:thiol-disulfide isomerase/thioredoxin
MKPLALAALIIGVGGAGAAGYLAYQQYLRQAAPPAPAEAPPAQLAERIPEFKLADRDGAQRSLADWPGKSLIVNFWATWCAPCRREIPLLSRLQQQYGPEGFQVIGIAADYRDKVIAYADQAGIGYPLLIGEQEALDAATAFGIQVIGFPFTVFSDRQGRIIACHVGELTQAKAQVILAAVNRVNQGQTSPGQARTEIEAGLSRLKAEGDSPPG